MRLRSLRHGRQQAGFSIVELMVAIAIGLFMLAGFIASFTGMSSAFAAQDGLSQLHDNERLALTVLTHTVRAAGYFPDPLKATAATSLPAATLAGVGDLAAGQGIVGTSVAAPAGETVTTRYVTGAGEAMTDCLGRTNKTGAPLLITNTYSVSADNELVCSLDGVTTALVSKVKSLTVLYGTDVLASGGVDRYLDAEAVTAAGLWPQVRTVRIEVRFLNPYAGTRGQPPTVDWVQTVNLMNKT